MPLAPGDVFAGYTVVRQIGSGGMGEVYLVRHPRLPRHDALKLLNRELSAEADFVARFLREADIVSRLSHRHIVSIYDRGEEAGQLWLTMRYVEGIDAEAALAQAGGLLPAPRAVHIVTGVATALDAAHRHHLIHRDVKPANILLSPADDDEPEQVFLTDFGIAKSLDAEARVTRTGLVVATFDYASPEQIEAQTLDSRSDVYSLACVLYRLLTGSVPYPGDTMLAPVAGHLSLPPPRPTAVVPWLPPALDDVVARGMAKDPAERFPTCRALAAAAATALDDFPAPPAPPYRVYVARFGNGSGAGTSVGPLRTEDMADDAAQRLAALVRRTRFFDLPEQLTGPRPAASGSTTVSVEIACAGQAHRVVADLDTVRRPPEFDDLVSTIERMATVAAPAPAPPVPPAPVPVPPVPPPDQGDRPRDDDAVRTTGTPPVPGRSAPAPTPLPPPTPPPPGPGAPPPGPPPWESGAPVPGPPPWAAGSTAPRRQGRRGLVAVAAVTAIVVGGGITTWLLLDREGEVGNGTTSSVTTESGPTTTSTPPTTTPPAPTTPATPEAEAAFAALPTSASLATEVLVAPRAIGPGNTDLFLIDTGASSATRLTGGPERDVSPILSPDRNTVIYIRRYADGTDELRTVAPDGTGDRRLFDSPPGGCAHPGQPAWNPGQPSQLAIACNDASDRTTLRLISLDGATVRDLDPGVPHIGDLAFSPDGAHLVFWGNESRDAGEGPLIRLATGGSGERRVITEAGSTDNDPVWSPDGETIAFSRGFGDGRREIFVATREGSGARSLRASDGSADSEPAWSPDGDLIAFTSDRPGSASGDQLWVMTADGGDLRQLPAEGEAFSTTAWGVR